MTNGLGASGNTGESLADESAAVRSAAPEPADISTGSAISVWATIRNGMPAKTRRQRTAVEAESPFMGLNRCRGSRLKHLVVIPFSDVRGWALVLFIAAE